MQEVGTFNHRPLTHDETVKAALLHGTVAVLILVGIFGLLLANAPGDATGFVVALQAGLCSWIAFKCLRIAFCYDKLSIARLTPDCERRMHEMVEHLPQAQASVYEWMQQGLVLRQRDLFAVRKHFEAAFQLELETNPKLREVMDTIDGFVRPRVRRARSKRKDQ